MKAILPVLLLTICCLSTLHAQYWNGTDSLYGNEWIQYDQDYVKFKIAEDGFYRLDKSILEAGGVPVDNIEARHFQFWHLGLQIPVVATTDGLMTAQDDFVLYAEQNKGEFDTHLFRNGLADQLNPEYSLFTDTAAYFITWNTSEDGLRMEEVGNPTDNLPPVERFFDDELKMVFSQNYSYLNYCADDRCFLIFSNYDNSEGYAYDPGSHISNYTLNPKHVYSDGNGAYLETRTTNNLTASASRGRLEILVNENQVASRPISSKPSLLQNRAFVEMQEVFEGMEVALKGMNGPDDLHAISLMNLIYPRTFNFENRNIYHLNIEASIIPKHLYFEDFDGGDQMECWNVTTGELIKVDADSAGHYRMRLESDDETRTLIIRNPETSVREVDKIYPVNFRDYAQLDPNYIIVAHPQLFDDGSGNNWVLEYAQYRASDEGGNFTPVIVPITVLYDQFAYGIPYHPSAVRHFTQWFSKNWSDPQHMFLMGKGVVAYQDRQNENPWQMIPCFGSPGADVLLCSDNLYRPILPVGRIPVLEGSEIETYLEKVKLHEGQYDAPSTFEAREWAKNAVHLSGGNLQIPFEINLIRSELDDMKNDLEDGMIGMTVHTFQKKTSGAVVVSDNQRLTELINDGVSLVTYFGHSGVQLLDFQIIDNVNTLEPNDRFHVFMAMGCYAGDIFHPSRRSYSETWTLADKRGSIATVANSSAGFIPSLEVMGSKIYDNYGGKYYGQAIGLSIWDAVNQFLEENRDSTNSLYFSTDVELAFSLNICGDPAVKLITSDGPDFQIDATTVGIDEDILTTENDSFTLHFDMVNIGKVSTDSIVIRIEQILPNDDVVIVHEDQYLPPLHRDSLSVRLENLKEKAVGFNKINITIDALNKVQEWPNPEGENNNDLSYNASEYCFYITSDDARPVYPEEFAIVGQADITLIASTSNSHTEQKSYLIEIDTTALFNSNEKKSTKIDGRGGVISWKPDITYVSNTVYYWRITPDSVGRGQYTWRDASFIYLQDEGPGWNQSHYYQFLKDDFDGLVLNDRKKRWEYIRQFTDLKIKNVVVNDDQFLRPAIIKNVTVDWEYYQFNPWKSPVTNTTRGGVFVTVYDPAKIESLLNPSPGLYGSINNTGNNIPVFAFETTTYEGRVALMQFLENHVPNEHYVVFMPVREPTTKYGIEDWASDRDSAIGKSIFDVLIDMGATQTDLLQAKGEVPYIFAYQMNNPDFPIKEAVGNEGEELELNVPMPGYFKEGSVYSVDIGPASEWKDLNWANSELNLGSEEFELSVIGLSANGARDTLMRNITNNNTTLDNIDAQQYPQLQLSLFSRDSNNLTSPQLDFWRINYASLPEVAVDLNFDYEFYRDTLQQGENLRLRYGIANIGQYDTDSLLIHYAFINSKNQTTLVSKRVDGLRVGQIVTDEIEQSTIDMSGTYRLVVTINPNMDQPELYDWNNSIVLPYYVEGDKRNPILDVTFDGLHILDGDLVSAKPEIRIGLEDENTYLALNDTSLFELSLHYPGEPLPRHVSFSEADVAFFPGTIDDNRASITIQRAFEKDGVYRLIVNAKDRSGNISGDIDYQVRFEIVTATSISEMINYPNPFSTSTKFVYTLTGDRSPSFYKIQIVTLSGKVVRELTQDDMGPLRVGKHMTDYVYDGTDEFGERLANGVYLYRFIARDENGAQLDHRDVGISQFSKKGWSKMVILR